MMRNVQDLAKEKWTPKHIGLVSTLHQYFRSNDIVNLINKAGHCIIYEDLLKIDKTLVENALESIDKDTGAGIQKKGFGKFVYFSADNLDVHSDLLDGKEMFNVTQVTISWHVRRTNLSMQTSYLQI